MASTFALFAELKTGQAQWVGSEWSYIQLPANNQWCSQGSVFSLVLFNIYQ